MTVGEARKSRVVGPIMGREIHEHSNRAAVERRPKLLFLAWYFPPVQASGCVRTWNIAKWLARLGWEVTVVTPHPSLWRCVEDPEKVTAQLEQEGIQRILTSHPWRFLAPDYLKCWNNGFGWFVGGICRKIARYRGVEREIGWVKAAEHACSMLTPNDVDVILASGTPFASFRLAKHLSDKLGCPYVLDYRDPWTQNTDSKHRSAVMLEETKLLAGCSAVTAVSNFLDGRSDVGPRLHVITNGFDVEEMAGVEPYDFGHFAIVYTGTFIPPERVITPVMDAARRLRGMRVDWRFHYYGPHGVHVHEQAERFGIMERIVLHGSVSRAKVLSALKGAGVAVVITSVLDEATLPEKAIVTGKIFEALGLGTPVLLISPHVSFVERIIQTTGLAGVYAGSDNSGIASFLTNAMSGRTPKPKNPAAYAWSNIAKKLDVVLRRVVEDSKRNKEKLLCAG